RVSVSTTWTPMFGGNARFGGWIRLPLMRMLPFPEVPVWRRTRRRLMVCDASFGSQTSPMPSLSKSAWLVLASFGQLSSASQMVSPSVSPPPPGVQTPAWQVSGIEQTSPSLQGVAFGFGWMMQPAGSTQMAVLHCGSAEPSVQVGGAPVWQRCVPVLQDSTPLQTRSSLQSELAVQLVQAAGTASGMDASTFAVTGSQPALLGPA